MNDRLPNFFVGALCGLFVGFLIGGYVANSNMENRAVQQKAADWIPDEHGKPVFTWKK